MRHFDGVINIIGGGLAGSEAAFYLLKRGYKVCLYERRPGYDDQAHETSLFGELVCSNSLKSNQLDNACGLLKEEMRKLDSLTMDVASETSVPSGNALSVDRVLFAEKITSILRNFDNLLVKNEHLSTLPDGPTIVATGPLTNEDLLTDICKYSNKNGFSFFDASAPIVRKDSINFEKAYFKSRFEQGDSSYINCPFTRDEYYSFVNALMTAERAPLHSFDTHYFEGCLPVEIIASRGIDTLRYGPLKPFGLAREGEKPYAVAQLRQDDKLGDCYNLVGFQTNLTYPEQKRVFRMIPGLENAEFVRYGLMHRNSYLDSPRMLNSDLSLKGREDCFIAGQLSGVEGYVESAATGIVAAINLIRKLEGKDFIEVPKDTVLGSLLSYILTSSSARLEPMNANWSIVKDSNKRDRTPSIQKSLKAIQSYWDAINE